MIHEIKEEDNPFIAEIIRRVMTEFGADPATTVLGEESINHMFENYQNPRSIYYVAKVDGRIAGGSGIKQLDGTAENICELQRMFLLPEARGKGIGKSLIQLCVEKAKGFGYEMIYLESLTQMKDAFTLYEKTGFRKIEKPLGFTGHGGCNIFMVLNLK